MLIQNSESLFKALEEGWTIILDKEGEPHTQSWAGYGYDLARATLVSSRFIKTNINDLQFAMVNLLEQEAINNHGPNNLTYPLPLCGRSFNELASRARLILGNGMVGHIVSKELEDQPKPIREGVTAYLQSLWQKKHPKDDICFPMIKSFVIEQVKTLKESPGHLLGHLACNYTLTSKELKLHMKYLEKGFQDAIQETWSRQHKEDFNKDGVYTIFDKDCKRETPFLNGWRFDHHTFDGETLQKLYREKLKEEFPEPSMTAIVGICMSQTILPIVAEIVRGMGTPHPLCPYIPPNSPEMPENLLVNVSNDPPTAENPRRELFHTPENILFRYCFGISLTSLFTAKSEEVGNVKFTLRIPKKQFPLPLDSKPDLQLMDIVLTRDKGFEGILS